nr:Hsp70 family protein [Propionibacterium sp.]
MTAFGIDFGTTNSVLACTTAGGLETVALDLPPAEFAELGFDRVLPTVLADDRGILEFGWKAKRNPNKLAAVKRLFKTDDDVQVGSHHLRVEEAAAVFFRQIKDRAAASGLYLDRAVVTIPANSRGAARFRTKVSAGLSGIEVLALVNEPTAAAMAYARTIRDGQRVLVFDWGGGTLDVTVLQNVDGAFVEETSKGIQQLGGIDLDEAFERSLRSRLPVGSRIDPFDLELAKVKLSTQEATNLSLVGGGVLEVTRGDLEDAIRPLIHRTREPVDKCLAELRGARIDHLVMVGGSAKIPYAQRFIREILRLEPMAAVDPMTAIAEGAALAAGILTGEVEDNDFFVGTEHALGVVVHNQGPDKPEFSVLIPRNTKLPAQATDGYVPTHAEQQQVRVQIIEGDPDQPFLHDDNVILKDWEIKLEPAEDKQDNAFTVTFQYDVDGILHVIAVNQKTGRVMLDEELTFGAAGTKQDLIAMRRRIDGLRTDAAAPAVATPASGRQLAPESVAAITRARDKILPYLDGATQATMQGLIDALVASDPDGEPDARRALEIAVREHSYLL